MIELCVPNTDGSTVEVDECESCEICASSSGVRVYPIDSHTGTDRCDAWCPNVYLRAMESMYWKIAGLRAELSEAKYEILNLELACHDYHNRIHWLEFSED